MSDKPIKRIRRLQIVIVFIISVAVTMWVCGVYLRFYAR